jgi:hypothetical protein
LNFQPKVQLQVPSTIDLLPLGFIPTAVLFIITHLLVGYSAEKETTYDFRNGDTNIVVNTEKINGD